MGILGGMFDPIHFGHLDAAEAARSALHLDEILVMPSSAPPHRRASPFASPYHRFALASLAVNERRGYRVSDLELMRPGTSYTADTLRALHAEGWTPLQLFFIIGADACAEIATWREFPAILDAANFVVIARPGMSLEAATSRTPAVQTRMRMQADRRDAQATRVIAVEADTRDVSSTMIRTRLSARQAIDDLVPSAVAAHILRHQLYGAVADLHGNEEGKHD